jgi:hypothetical protein
MFFGRFKKSGATFQRCDAHHSLILLSILETPLQLIYMDKYYVCIT